MNLKHIILPLVILSFANISLAQERILPSNVQGQIFYDTEEDIVVQVGEIFTFAKHSNSSVGTRFDLILPLQGLKLVAKKGIYQCDDGRTGCPTLTFYTLVAEEAGETALTFKKSYRGDADGEESFKITVEALDEL
jgi:predicted secreted protein